jgi:hypothetical protein
VTAETACIPVARTVPVVEVATLRWVKTATQTGPATVVMEETGEITAQYSAPHTVRTVYSLAAEVAPVGALEVPAAAVEVATVATPALAIMTERMRQATAAVVVVLSLTDYRQVEATVATVS